MKVQRLIDETMSKVIFKCPILQEFWDKYIANRDWNKTCKEISTILDGLEYFSVEYNSNTSAHHPNKGDDIVRTCTKMKCKS